MPLPVSEKAVLHLVQSKRATSQVQIARHLGVSPNTIHSVICRLLEQRAVEQSSVERQQKGRPVLHYRMRLPAPMLVIQWLGTEWHGGLIYPDPREDKIIRWQTVSTPDAATAVDLIVKNARGLLRDAGVKPRDLTGCALSMNAARISTGKLVSSVIPWADELNISQLEKKLGCPVEILSAPGVAEAELAMRVRENCRRLVVFNVGDGVSAHGSAYTNLWSEAATLDGEIGHIIVEPVGRLCGCGHRGCLETLLSGPSIQQKVRDEIKAGMITKLSKAAKGTPKELFDTMERLDADRDDSYACTVVEEFLERCAWAVSVISNMQNPDVIVMSGYALTGRADWVERIKKLARPKILQGEQRALTLEFPLSTGREHLRRLAENALLAKSYS